MTKNQQSISKIQEVLNFNKEIVVIPTESTYLIATKYENKENLARYAKEIKTQSEFIFIFKNLDQIKAYTQDLQSYVQFLIKILTPGPSVFRLKGNKKLNNQDFLAYIPQNLDTQSLLEGFNEPLVALIPYLENNIPAINIEAVSQDRYLQKLNILETKQKTSKILPIVLDMTVYQYVSVINPGILRVKEIRKLLPKSISLSAKYQKQTLGFTNRKKQIKLSNNFDDFAGEALTLVLGAKEKIAATFKHNFLEYFQYKQLDNFILLNLGSQAHLENLVKNFYKNLNQTGRLGIENIVLLNQDFGTSNLGILANTMYSSSVATATQNTNNEVELKEKMELQEFSGIETVVTI